MSFHLWEFTMKPAPFDYYAPDTVADAVALLARLEDEDVEAKILAGGQSLMPMLNLRVARPDALVDLRKLESLKYIRDDGDFIAIGAMTSKSAAEDSALIKQKQPLFQHASYLIGHRQIRNRGTVGGSFAHADPAAEYGAAAMALGIEMKIVGPDGQRLVPAEDFYITFLTADIDATEILTEVRVPVMAAGAGWSFQEMARRDGDLALAGVAVTMRVAAGVCEQVRVAVFGVNGSPASIAAAEAMVEGQAPSKALFEQAGRAAGAAIDKPIADVHGSAEYRRQLVSVLVARSLEEAQQRAV
jgi:CO/xanthine dehydrogenase FAD-binding subunit